MLLAFLSCWAVAAMAASSPCAIAAPPWHSAERRLVQRRPSHMPLSRLGIRALQRPLRVDPLYLQPRPPRCHPHLRNRIPLRRARWHAWVYIPGPAPGNVRRVRSPRSSRVSQIRPALPHRIPHRRPALQRRSRHHRPHGPSPRTLCPPSMVVAQPRQHPRKTQRFEPIPRASHERSRAQRQFCALQTPRRLRPARRNYNRLHAAQPRTEIIRAGDKVVLLAHHCHALHRIAHCRIDVHRGVERLLLRPIPHADREILRCEIVRQDQVTMIQQAEASNIIQA